MRRAVAFTFCVLAIFVSRSASQSPSTDGKVPADLVITLTLGGTIQFSGQYTYTISSDGTVVIDDRSNYLPRHVEVDISQLILMTPGSKQAKKSDPPPPKPPERADRLTPAELQLMIDEFERSGFYQMNDHYYGDPDLKEGTCTNHAEEKGLSILANGTTKKVAFFLGCTYGESSPLKSFLALYQKVSEVLQTVKATPVKQ